MNDQMIEAMERIGGKRWTKGDKDRVYFNDLPAWYGLETNRYNTGNISSASLNGEAVSNSAAKRLIEGLSGKAWYDVPTGTWQYQHVYAVGADKALYHEAISRIKARLEAEMATASA